jgi:hypothetical protein
VRVGVVVRVGVAAGVGVDVIAGVRVGVVVNVEVGVLVGVWVGATVAVEVSEETVGDGLRIEGKLQASVTATKIAMHKKRLIFIQTSLISRDRQIHPVCRTCRRRPGSAGQRCRVASATPA